MLLNVRGLNNFRPKPQVRKRAMPDYTVDTTQGMMNFLTPGDWATIYNVTPIYTTLRRTTRHGAHVGVVGQTYAPLSDITNFRNASGLSAAKVNYACIDPTTANCTGTYATAPASAGDLDEADLDIEWAGGIAKNATVDFVYAPYSDACSNSACTLAVNDPVTGNGYSVFDALQHAVQYYKIPGTTAVLPVISMSYSDCEESFVGDPGYVTWVTDIGSQANSQGQTIVVASGDTGAFGCDFEDYPAQYGVSVSVPADSPNYTGVGGTTLSGDESSPSTYLDRDEQSGELRKAIHSRDGVERYAVACCERDPGAVGERQRGEQRVERPVFCAAKLAADTERLQRDAGALCAGCGVCGITGSRWLHDMLHGQRFDRVRQRLHVRFCEQPGIF